MRVLITGSSGFVGSALKQGLEAAGVPFDTVSRLAATTEGIRCVPGLDDSKVWEVPWPQGLSELPFERYSCIIHLAIPSSGDKQPMTEAIEAHTAPVRAIVSGIQRCGSSCLVLFVSSQSATSDAVSQYGRGKWEAERILAASGVPWAVLKPGLIVGPSSRGIFAGIVSLAKRFPVIGVPSGSLMKVQPVLLQDVVTACVRIAQAPNRHAGQAFELALAPRSLPAMVKEACSLLGLRRLVVPIPWQMLVPVLSVSEALSIPLPASLDSLYGLMASRELSSEESLAAIDMELHALTRESIGVEEPSVGLHAEGEFLFAALFRVAPSRDVVARYVASQAPHLLNGSWIDLETIVRKHLDVEAIEFATRRRKTVLSQKMLILSYITELYPEYASYFINTKTCRLKAFVALGVSGLRAAWSLLYGSYLVRRFSLLKRPSHG